MFRQGADTIYRLLRRFIKDHRRRLAQPALAASRRLSYFPTTIYQTLYQERSLQRTPYFKKLPAEVRAAWLRHRIAVAKARRTVPQPLGSSPFDAFMQQYCATEQRIVQHFGRPALVSLRLLWENRPPRFVEVDLVCAADLPRVLSDVSPGRRFSMAPNDDSHGGEETVDATSAPLALANAYAVVCLVPPDPSGLLKRRDLGELQQLESTARARLDSKPQQQLGRRHTVSTCLAPCHPLAGLDEVGDDEPSRPSARCSPRRPTATATAVNRVSTGSSHAAADAAPPPMVRTSSAEPPPVKSLGVDPSRWSPDVRTKITAHVLTRQTSNGPEAPAGSYGHVVSSVRRDTCEPQWQQHFELELEGGVMTQDGSHACPGAPYSMLRVEVWNRVPWAPDDFLGEATWSLVPLLDFEPHRAWLELTDPQQKANLPGGQKVSGRVLLELVFVKW